MRPASCVLRPASSVRSVTAKVLKIMSPDFMQIFVMCAVCAQKVMVAPPVILDFLWPPKQVFNILIFFSETASRWRLILCHYIP